MRLNKKKDEETLFNKAGGPCQATISPQGSPEMSGSRDQQGGVEVAEERGRRVTALRKGTCREMKREDRFSTGLQLRFCYPAMADLAPMI